MSEVVLPGEPVNAKHPNLKLGPGVLQLLAGPIISTKAGTLCHNQNRSKWWVESNSRRYIPAAQEAVVGVVVGKNGAEGFRVGIGGPHNANLDALAFEGATKRNRPNLKVVGSLLYARVSLAHKDMEPELECFDAQTRKSDGYGELKGGFVTGCSLKMCRQLLDPKHFLLPLLGSKFPLDAAIGMNGRVWVNSKELRHVIAAVRCIERVDPEGENLDEKLVNAFLDTFDI
ncbi:hypothetical protein BDM02DRAFT_3139280 [Thelephora ganbajun]|uniref:Uncharacterized protein n=1 Tax=Thelephora ganbajun TaxID=370292 RepID=A0ACB6ZQB1_THEGA|nr:hypothetical protein BDM02DRAFT_3139280 [Thelephora ganbajun]